MLNNCAISGRLTRDPELRHTVSGTAVCSFTLAVDRDFRNQSGEKETDWIDVVCWKSTAEYVHRYATKGRLLMVSGRLQTRNYTDKSGNNRKAVEIIASSVYFGDKHETQNAAPVEASDEKFTEIDSEEELPF